MSDETKPNFRVKEGSFREDWDRGACLPGVTIYEDGIVSRVGNCYTLQHGSDFVVFPAAQGPTT